MYYVKFDVVISTDIKLSLEQKSILLDATRAQMSELEEALKHKVF